MGIRLNEGTDQKSGHLEFYMTGLDLFQDFDKVVKQVADVPDIKEVERVEGLFFRIGKFDSRELRFHIVYSEDVGTYAFSTDDTDQSNERLRQLLKGVVDEMNRIA